MNSLMQSDIFFFVSSIGFIVIALLSIFLILACIRALSSLIKILEKIESSLDSIGDATMDLIEDMRSNIFFRMFFHPKKKQHAAEPRKRKVE